MKKYAQGFRTWNKWRRDHPELSPLPVEPLQLAVFIAANIQSNSRYGRIDTVCCGLAWLHKTLGLPNPCDSGTVQALKEAAVKPSSEERTTDASRHEETGRKASKQVPARPTDPDRRNTLVRRFSALRRSVHHKTQIRYISSLVRQAIHSPQQKRPALHRRLRPHRKDRIINMPLQHPKIVPPKSERRQPRIHIQRDAESEGRSHIASDGQTSELHNTP